MAYKVVKNWNRLHTIVNFESFKSTTYKLRYAGAGLIATSFAAYVTCSNPVHAAQTELNIKNFMADPITSLDHLKKNQNDMKTKMELLIMKIQSGFVKSLESLEEDGTKFIVDRWQRKEGGGGITCVMQNGQVFEKAGVNISVVTGTLPPSAVQQMRARGKQMDEGSLPFFAAGVSAVIHPTNPMVIKFFFTFLNSLLSNNKFSLNFLIKNILFTKIFKLLCIFV